MYGMLGSLLATALTLFGGWLLFKQKQHHEMKQRIYDEIYEHLHKTEQENSFVANKLWALLIRNALEDIEDAELSAMNKCTEARAFIYKAKIYLPAEFSRDYKELIDFYSDKANELSHLIQREHDRDIGPEEFMESRGRIFQGIAKETKEFADSHVEQVAKDLRSKF